MGYQNTLAAAEDKLIHFITLLLKRFYMKHAAFYSIIIIFQIFIIGGKAVCDWVESDINSNGYYLEMTPTTYDLDHYVAEIEGRWTTENGYVVLEKHASCTFYIESLPRSDVENIESIMVSFYGYKENDNGPNDASFGVMEKTACSYSLFWERGDEYQIDTDEGVYSTGWLNASLPVCDINCSTDQCNDDHARAFLVNDSAQGLYVGWVRYYIQYQAAPSVISLTPSSLSQTATEGIDASSQSFSVGNSGDGTLSYSISVSEPWLSCTPTSGTSTGENNTITVNYSTSDLSAGTYSATITISASEAINSPQTVPVSLTVSVESGSLQVTISPTAAVSAGAQWRVDGGNWQNSGSNVSGLAVGSHTVDFKEITGWTTPEPLSVNIDDGQVTNASVSYTQGDKYALNITISGSGVVRRNPDSDTYDAGTEVDLQALPNTGWVFSHWGGDLDLTDNPATITINSDVDITATFLEDSDNDGISDEEENSGPNAGDGNGDGLLDSQQSNVTSLQTYDDQYFVTIETPLGTMITHCQAIDNPSYNDAPSNVEFPFGFFEFILEGIGINDTTTVTLDLPDGETTDIYYKYGPTPDDGNYHWYEFSYDGVTGAEIVNGTIILHFADSLKGDDDLTGNGAIFNIGGPGYNSCTYSISPTSIAINSDGGEGTIDVITHSGCSVDATADVEWIDLTGYYIGDNSGDKNVHSTLKYNVGANLGDARTGTITIVDKVFTIDQNSGNNEGCFISNLFQ